MTTARPASRGSRENWHRLRRPAGRSGAV